jgi:hypothetical protein
VSPVCAVGAWSTALPLCQRTCPNLNQPLNSGSCTKQLFSFSFSDTAPMSQLYIDPPVPAALQSFLWTISDGVLSTSTGVGGSVHVLKVSNPAWLSLITDGQWMRLNASVQVTNGGCLVLCKHAAVTAAVPSGSSECVHC